MIIPEDVLLSSVYHKSWYLPIKSSLPDYCILLCSSIVYNDFFLFCHAVARVIEICCVHTPARLCAPAFIFCCSPPPALQLPVLPQKLSCCYPSHLFWCFKAENRKSGGDWSWINPEELQMSADKKATKHIHKLQGRFLALAVDCLYLAAFS